MYDLLLRGGTLIDGTGGPAFVADLAVKDGRIVAVGSLGETQTRRGIDCSGLCVSPGWVDLHGHADFGVFDYPVGLNLLIQGCTFTLSGNCGQGPAPVEGRAVELIRAGEGRGYHTATIGALAEMHPQMEWSLGDFLDAVERARPGLNYAQLAGHGDIRRCVMGHEPAPATKGEVEEMKSLLERCLDEGALGLSSGLVFIPGCWSETEELVELARVVARHDGLYTSHIRGERETNIEATREMIDTAERSGVRANVSHMQSKYPAYGNGAQKVEMLKAARSRGVDITCDYDVFNMNGGSLGGFLQIHHLTTEELLVRLRSAEGRAELKRTMRETDPYHPLGRFGPGGVPYRRAWDRVIIWDCPHDRSLEGKSVAAVGARRGIDYEDALFDLTLAENGAGPRMINDYIEDEHYRIVPWEHCIVPSLDTWGLSDPAQTSRPIDFRYQLETGAPSTLGLFPRVLGQYVREERMMTLEEGVRRMTSLPMQRLGIADRGQIGPGMWADLVVFDADRIAMRGPKPDPERMETCWPAGISFVVVNGVVAMEGHTYTGARAGQVVRRPS